MPTFFEEFQTKEDLMIGSMATSIYLKSHEDSSDHKSHTLVMKNRITIGSGQYARFQCGGCGIESI